MSEAIADRHGVSPSVTNIPSLDGIRAVSVLIVLVSHTGYGDVVPGGLGVTVFFFLSGFLITTLILDEQVHTGRVSIRNFYVRRFLRLIPPLLITLAIAYALVAAGALGGGTAVRGVASQLLYFANYYFIFFDPGRSTPDGTTILWSLSVEEHFYIAYPVLITLLFTLRRARRAMLMLFVGICVVALAWRYHLATAEGFVDVRTYYATDTRFDSILFGCILAIWRNPVAGTPSRRLTLAPGVDRILRSWRSSPRMETAGCVLGASILLFTIVYREAVFRETARYTLQGIALMPLFHAAIRSSTRGVFRLLNVAVVARLGVISYAVYLIHDVIAHVLVRSDALASFKPVLVVATLSIAVAYGLLLDRFVDPYFRRLRRSFRTTQPMLVEEPARS